jgi:polar amino acid transport system substrate-binding protein
VHKSLSTTRGVALAAATLAAAALLTGCAAGGSGTSARPSSSIKAVVAPPTIQTAGTLKICIANTASPPNIYADASGNLVGEEVELAKHWSAKLGLKPDFVQADFSALIPTLQAQQCDVIMSSLYIKPAREKVVDFVPYLKSGIAVAVKKGSKSGITGYDESLCGKSVQVTVGTTAQDEAATLSTKCQSDGKKPIEVTTNKQATLGFQQLATGQIDAYIDAAELVGYYQGKSGSGVQMAGKPFDLINIGAATLKSEGKLHTALQTGFDAMVKDGTYLKVLTKWGQKQNAYSE